MSDLKDIAAVILAAGRSSRMGAFKPLMPMGHETVIEHVIGVFRTAGITDILVVLGHEADRLNPFLKEHGVRLVVNPDHDRGMFSSVQAGAGRLGDDCRAFFLMPADMPFVRPETLKIMLGAFHESGMDVCRPCYRGKRGHPPLISAKLIKPILTFTESGGMRALLARHQKTSIAVACDDPGILIDLDTPEDFKNATGGENS
jgi:molybdenum cofactor cytidylyltransferase